MDNRIEINAHTLPVPDVRTGRDPGEAAQISTDVPEDIYRMADPSDMPSRAPKSADRSGMPVAEITRSRPKEKQG